MAKQLTPDLTYRVIGLLLMGLVAIALTWSEVRTHQAEMQEELRVVEEQVADNSAGGISPAGTLYYTCQTLLSPVSTLHGGAAAHGITIRPPEGTEIQLSAHDGQLLSMGAPVPIVTVDADRRTIRVTKAADPETTVCFERTGRPTVCAPVATWCERACACSK